jgi:hypothetical protein
VAIVKVNIIYFLRQSIWELYVNPGKGIFRRGGAYNRLADIPVRTLVVVGELDVGTKRDRTRRL